MYSVMSEGPICGDHFTRFNECVTDPVLPAEARAGRGAAPEGFRAGDPSAILAGAAPAQARGGRKGAPAHCECGQRAPVRERQFQLKSYWRLLFGWNL